MIFYLPTSPEEAAREMRVLQESSAEILASPRLRREALEKLGLLQEKKKSPRAASGKRKKKTRPEE